MTGLSDSFHRPIDYLRISVTDRCNLRCVYCMPADGVCLMPRKDILSYEEIHKVTRVAAGLGISKIKLTGGEPLVRLKFLDLVKLLSGIKGIDDVTLTTNGVLLARYAAGLKQAGLKRVNISLDTLKADKFTHISRGKHELNKVLDGIRAAELTGLTPVKLNMVVMAGINDDELVDFASKTVTDAWNVRFIECMPFNGQSRFLPVSEMTSRIQVLGKLEPASPGAGNGPAKYFRFPGAGGTVGFITPVSEHFCFNCNRLRLTADGKLRPCLLSASEIDIRPALRDGLFENELAGLIEKAVAIKPRQHRLGDGYVPKDRPFSQVGG